MRFLTRNEEIVLLVIWRLADNAYGVSIKHMIHELTGQEWSFGQVYVPLDKLTQKGMIVKTMSEPQGHRGGRSKCMYTLSSEGMTALNEGRKLQTALWQDIHPMAFETEG